MGGGVCFGVTARLGNGTAMLTDGFSDGVTLLIGLGVVVGNVDAGDGVRTGDGFAVEEETACEDEDTGQTYHPKTKTIRADTARPARALNHDQPKNLTTRTTITPSNTNITNSHNITALTDVGGIRTSTILITPNIHANTIARMISPRLCHGLLLADGGGWLFLTRFRGGLLSCDMAPILHDLPRLFVQAGLFE